MRKEWAPRALRALAGALFLAITTATSALAAPSPELVRSAVAPSRAAEVTLGAALDRSSISPFRIKALETALAAAAARLHPVAKPAPVAKPRHVVRNHLWIPSLGISRWVAWFPCSRTQEPGPYVYRWGCAGRNNVYLLGHASGVFRALHDAYLNGRLRVGMVAVYADAKGRVTRYRVTGWKVVLPTDISWASATRTRTMTLQTCMGADSSYRLDVRLVQF
jgi:sortase (surface protein transpeptidase)